MKEKKLQTSPPPPSLILYIRPGEGGRSSASALPSPCRTERLRPRVPGEAAAARPGMRTSSGRPGSPLLLRLARPCCRAAEPRLNGKRRGSAAGAARHGKHPRGEGPCPAGLGPVSPPTPDTHTPQAAPSSSVPAAAGIAQQRGGKATFRCSPPCAACLRRSPPR